MYIFRNKEDLENQVKVQTHYKERIKLKDLDLESYKKVEAEDDKKLMEKAREKFLDPN